MLVAMDKNALNRVERRLAAIQAADIAGYSRFIGVDEEGTLNRIRAIRVVVIDPAVATHRRRLVKTTGDGLMIEFASVVEALRCTVDIQHQMADAARYAFLREASNGQIGAIHT